MLKTLLFLGLVAAAAYGVFLKSVGGKSLAGHASEVWTSDLVQRKFSSIKDDMREDLEERLAKARAEKGAADTTKRDGRDFVSEEDRESLSALIEKKTKAKK